MRYRIVVELEMDGVEEDVLTAAMIEALALTSYNLSLRDFSLKIVSSWPCGYPRRAPVPNINRVNRLVYVGLMAATLGATPQSRVMSTLNYEDVYVPIPHPFHVRFGTSIPATTFAIQEQVKIIRWGYPNFKDTVALGYSKTADIVLFLENDQNSSNSKER